jgi:hypothetical protein
MPSYQAEQCNCRTASEFPAHLPSPTPKRAPPAFQCLNRTEADGSSVAYTLDIFVLRHTAPAPIPEPYAPGCCTRQHPNQPHISQEREEILHTNCGGVLEAGGRRRAARRPPEQRRWRRAFVSAVLDARPTDKTPSVPLSSTPPTRRRLPRPPRPPRSCTSGPRR